MWLRGGSEAHAVAFEIEVSPKEYSAYLRILKNFKLNTTGYEQVVWVANSRQIAKRLMRARAAMGLSDKFMKIVPLRTFEGQPFLDRALKLDR